jgi:hypothetical protein
VDSRKKRVPACAGALGETVLRIDMKSEVEAKDLISFVEMIAQADL